METPKSITHFKKGEYERFQVRVNRHGIAYTKTFRVKRSRAAAMKKAVRYRNALIETLAVDPATTAGSIAPHRSKGGVHIEKDTQWGTSYCVASYRRKDGKWDRVMRSIKKHGKKKAKHLAREKADQLHTPHPGHHGLRAMPPKEYIEMKLKHLE